MLEGLKVFEKVMEMVVLPQALQTRIGNLNSKSQNWGTGALKAF